MQPHSSSLTDDEPSDDEHRGLLSPATSPMPPPDSQVTQRQPSIAVHSNSSVDEQPKRPPVHTPNPDYSSEELVCWKLCRVSFYNVLCVSIAFCCLFTV